MVISLCTKTMSFKLATPLNTRSFEMANKNGGSFTSVVGALYAQAATGGALALATTTTLATVMLYRANEATATTAAFHALKVYPGDVFLADTTANTAIAQVGQRGVIDATGLLYTNSGTDVATGPFVMTAIVGAAADRKALVQRV